MKVYTKKGDQGETSLFDGSRVGKSNMRIDLLGYLDELNSFIGLLRSTMSADSPKFQYLQKLQGACLEIGSEIANPRLREDQFRDFNPLILELEEMMDQMDSEMEPLYNFILPGGTSAASISHVCRTIARKCERLFFELRSDITLNDSIGRFLNRVSDYFFVVGRHINMESNTPDITWNPKVGLGI